MPHHQRLVLSICQGAATSDLMRHAAEMARLLGIEIFGVFVEDQAVLGAASFPFTREFRLHSHEWHPFDSASVETEFRHAAGTAKRLLDTITQALGVRCEFQVRRGDPAGVVAELLCSSDIVVLSAPNAESDQLTQSFLRAWRTARGSSASVLLLPPGRVRPRGPVVALLGGEQAVQTAAHIAAIAGEPLILLGPPEPLAATKVDLPPGRVSRRSLERVTDNTLRFTLADSGERLLVLDRDGLAVEPEAAVLRVAATRGTPVLLVGPAGS